MIRAIVFDFDGLIFDSELPEYETYRALFAEHGADLPMEVWGRCVGRDADFWDPMAYLEECIGQPVDREALRARRRTTYLATIAGQGPLPGVAEALDAAHAMGLGLAVASSSPRAWVEPHLERLGLLPRFDAVLTRDDVRRAKPDPELYLLAAERLGVEPRHAVAVEDSPNGALAARRAGMRVVLVPNAVTRALPLLCEVDERLETLDRVDLAELVGRLAARAAE